MMCKRYGYPTGSKWCEDTPKRVLENEVSKILWEFSVPNDLILEHNKSDIIIVDRVTKGWQIIYVACSFDA